MPVPKIGRRTYIERAAQRYGEPTPVQRAAADARPEDVTAVAEVDPVSLDPEECANELLAYIPEHVREKIHEAAGKMALPRWQVLLGYAMRMEEMGELFVPYILASTWEAGDKPSGIRVCKACGEKFRTKWPSAAYCCNRCHFGREPHSEDCPLVKASS